MRARFLENFRISDRNCIVQVVMIIVKFTFSKTEKILTFSPKMLIFFLKMTQFFSLPLVRTNGSGKNGHFEKKNKHFWSKSQNFLHIPSESCQDVIIKEKVKK